MSSANDDDSTVAFSSNFVNCSLVLPEYLGMLIRSSSYRSSGCNSSGRRNSPSNANNAYAADRLDKKATSPADNESHSQVTYLTPPMVDTSIDDNRWERTDRLKSSSSAVIRLPAASAYTRLAEGRISIP